MLEEERELIGKLKAGDPSAYHQLVDGYANRLFGLARALVGNADDAEEVVQETLSGVFRGIGSFRQQSSLWTWLARITARQALKLRNSGKRRQQLIRLADDVPDDRPRQPTGAATPVSVAAKLDVAAAIARLSDDHRRIIVLREIEQMSYTEISQALDMPLGTVESRLARRETSFARYWRIGSRETTYMNSPCQYLSRIAAFHDGQMSPQEGEAIETHLATGCVECSIELASLRQLSMRIESIAAPNGLSSDALARLHRHVDSLHDRSFLHFAEMLSGIAAALLIASSLFVMRGSDASAEPLPSWEQAALTLQPDVAPTQQPGSLHTAEWIVKDLSSSGAESR